MTSTYTHSVATWLDPDTGQELNHQELMKELSGMNAVLLGETHDQYDIHRWQLSVTTALYAHHGNLAVGFEMFPRRVQPVLDEWVAGDLDEDTFLEKVEWKTVWGFPADLYLPIFQFCREHKIPMLALNCYRELVSRVGKEGWDAIPENERDGLTPSKAASDAYRQYLFDLVGGFLKPEVQKQDEEGEARRARFVRAQQTWDRAFACNIEYARRTENPPLVIGIIGRGHLDYGHGTPYQLDDLGVDKVAVLSTTKTANPEANQINGIARAVYRLPD